MLTALSVFLGLLCLLLCGPLYVALSGQIDLDTPWHQRDRSASGLAPRPSEHSEAVVQVYGARTVQWRGAFAIHPWIAVKPHGADRYRVYQVIGWQRFRGARSLDVRETTSPDQRWYGAMPELFLDERGAAAEALIPRIEAAVQRYPWADEYRTWPGPNSNTFVAWVAREIPQMRLDLPPTAIGKDFLGSTSFIAPTPSGTGWQVSLGGLFGISVARKEGVEFNLLGLSAGYDFNDNALRWPGVGVRQLGEP